MDSASRAAFGRKLAGIVAFRIVRAADEGAVFSELQRQVARAADPADARVAAVFALRENQRRQSLVQRVEHIGDAQLLGVLDLGEKIAPEVTQNVFPVQFAGGDAVELLFEIGGEVVFDVFREEAFKEGGDKSALGLRHQLALVDCHIVAIAQRRQRRRIGRRAADAEFFHLLDQRCFRIARRRLGEMLCRIDLLLGEIFAGIDLRQTAISSSLSSLCSPSSFWSV